MQPPILIAGATASGKSDLALRLAEALDGVVINADALQVYAGWRVLSARPSEAEMAQVPHALYGHVGMDVSYSVGAWLRDLDPVLADATAAGKRAIIVGGTGLYFRALTEGLAEVPPVPDEIRAMGDQIRAAEGADGFIARLEERDAKTLALVDTANPMRLQRAWEVLQATGTPLRLWQAQQDPPRLPLDQTVPLHLDADRDWLADRIAQRMGLMIAGGALEECRAARAAGLDMRLPSARAIGAPELMAYLDGDLSLEAAEAQAIIATRQFAKRQRTWFRARMGDWHRIGLDAGTDRASILTAAQAKISASDASCDVGN